MSINRTCLHAFHIVASEGSFSSAAAAHHVSQPTLSAQVKELESRYRVNLFDRRGRGVKLTINGHSLYTITQKLFAFELEAEQLLLAAHSGTAGVLRIGADSPYLVIPLIAIYQSIYPDVKVKINFGNSKQLLNALYARQYGVIVLPGIRTLKNLYSLPLLNDRLIAFVNLQHPWAIKRSIKLTDLVGARIVLRERGSSTRLRFETIVKHRKMTLDEENLVIIGAREGVCEAVAAGLGIGIVAESEFGHDKRLHPLLIRDVKTRHTEYIACLNKRKDDAIIETFMGAAEMTRPENARPPGF